MSSYSVEFTSAAAREIRKLPKTLRTHLLDAIELLSTDPHPHGAKKLVGTRSAWRLCVGDHRVIYDVADAVMIVTVIRVAHRREVYR
ncbi:type II toxin-antitoxin system RelE family toxin [Curtobacterium sp. Leaf261]|uniref:type II toxin-antitoxin system RelE family toxin n=1 Tax=Curtobacterium sp. Leaf261 TaxID=1736311 RepID=UPI0006F2B489|nr:type II toxin-antitoxin system RelE/ParE family toxin [Curtobacterium sp. Leaf261]KQO64941.1 plasmid stabilization protein [Curtobacterium sp. Leaf261]